jgi:hypothetical protein
VIVNGRRRALRDGLVCAHAAVRLGIALVLAVFVLVGDARDAHPSSTIESTYRELGPWQVSTGRATAFGGSYALFYPSDLGANGFRHPIVTWGNGTAGTPANYTTLLTHLASWGFVVIASDSGMTGLGTEILDGASFLVEEDANPSSIFYRRLDVARIGACGHSQGAGGTLNATIDSDGLITSAVTIALPDPIFWTTPVPDMASFPESAKIFFIHGTIDPLATEPAAIGWYAPLRGIAVKASQKSAGHNQVQFPDTRLTGYVTAWMMYSLRDDAYARRAFFGSPAEIDTNAAWQDAAHKPSTIPQRRLAGSPCLDSRLGTRRSIARWLPTLGDGCF